MFEALNHSPNVTCNFTLVNPRTISSFSSETASDSELTKAQKAYEKFQNRPIVAFDTPALNTLNERNFGVVLLRADEGWDSGSY